MKLPLRFHLLSLWMICAAFCHAQSATEDLFIYLNGGSLDVFPAASVKSHSQDATSLHITLLNDSIVNYTLSEVDSVSFHAPEKLPKFTSFKFNNKYNDQVYTDVFAELTDNTVSATVGAIGKRLTPSFQLDTPDASAYLDGVLQQSKVSRPRFDVPLTYTLAPAGWRKMTRQLLQEEIWETPGIEGEVKQIPLTVDMLSTNAPSNYENREGLDKLLDDDVTTYFHSTWGTGTYEKLPLSENPYIEVSLAEDIKYLRFHYITRPDADRVPTGFSVMVSADGENWNEVKSLTSDDGMPLDYGQPYTSPTIDLGGAFRHLRFVMTSATYKNYLSLAEFSLYEVTPASGSTDPVLVQPAVYGFRWTPYGRNVTVTVDWLTNHATNVPRIDLNVEDGKPISSKTVYLNAEIIIDGAGVFPDMTDSVQVKGRGNTSWQGTYGKSPYRLKFKSKKKPFGLSGGKNWVLLANNQTGSMLTNAIALKVARLVGTAAANDIVPVEFYLNGEYRGSYNFTQHVGLAANSVDLDDETNAALFELDSYYDEPYKFRSKNYRLPVNIREPDLADDATGERLRAITSNFNDFETSVYEGTDAFVDKVDPEMLARYLFVNIFTDNREILHPKSCFLYREDMLALHSPYIFGPVWDFDWAFGYDGSYVYYKQRSTSDIFSNPSESGGYFHRDLAENSDEVKRCSYRLWKDFMNGQLTELLEYIDDYVAYVKPSFEHNATRWSDHTDYESNAADAKSWLQERANYLYTNHPVYDLTEAPVFTVGDVNLDGAITTADAVCVVNRILGLENETFDLTQADADKNEQITVNDVVHIVALALRQPSDALRLQQLPAAQGVLKPNRFALLPNSNGHVPVTLRTAEAAYAGLQFDVLLPDGISLTGLSLPAEWKNFSSETADLGNGRYRVMIYGSAQHPIPAGLSALLLEISSGGVVTADRRILSIDAATMVSNKGEETRLAPRSTTFDMEATGIENPSIEHVDGGDALFIESRQAGETGIYGADGRLLRTVSVKAGTNRISLPAGVYVINSQKVVIN